MSVHARWRWGAAALVLTVFALLSGAHLCGAAQDAGSRPLTGGGLACAEFWLNRYQTLVAAMIAGAIAFWAARLVFSQVAAQKFELIARQIEDMFEIRECATNLYEICNTVLSVHDDVRRPNPSFEGQMMAKFMDTSNNAFASDLSKARVAVSQLQRLASRPRGPLRTSQMAKAFAADCNVYIFYSHFGYNVAFVNNWQPGGKPITRTGIEQNEDALVKLNILRGSYNHFLKIYDQEFGELSSLQVQAYAAVR